MTSVAGFDGRQTLIMHFGTAGDATGIGSVAASPQH